MRGAALASAFMALIFSREATASILFPLNIQNHLALKAAPFCTICHRDDYGGPGTVVKPFGLTAMNKYGLSRLDTNQLRTVLDAMEANSDDSDGDGVGDIAELRAGTDPNIDVTGQGPGDLPRYGFYCAAAPGRHGSLGAGTVWIAGLVLSTWRIWSRRRPGR